MEILYQSSLKKEKQKALSIAPLWKWYFEFWPCNRVSNISHYQELEICLDICTKGNSSKFSPRSWNWEKFRLWMGAGTVLTDSVVRRPSWAPLYEALLKAQQTPEVYLMLGYHSGIVSWSLVSWKMIRRSWTGLWLRGREGASNVRVTVTLWLAKKPVLGGEMGLLSCHIDPTLEVAMTALGSSF